METIDEHHPGGFVREVLGAARTYYVRYNVGDCTISNASPAVVTLTNHGLLDDDPVVFRTDGSLPTGLTPGTVYYVNYVDANTFQVAATPDGTSINTSSAGSGTHSVATGNDSNKGLTTGRAGALLTIQKAADLAMALDFSTYVVTIQCAKSKYSPGAFVNGINLTSKFIGDFGSALNLVGDATTPTNCEIATDRANCIRAVSGATLDVKGFKLTTATSGSCILANVFAYVNVSGDMEFGASGAFHLYATGMSTIQRSAGAIAISGSATVSLYADDLAWIKWGGTHTITNTPNFYRFALADRMGNIVCTGATYSGSATGTRYVAQLNSLIFTNGGGASYFPGSIAGSTATGGQYA